MTMRRLRKQLVRPLLFALVLVLGPLNAQTVFACMMMGGVELETCCCGDHEPAILGSLVAAIVFNHKIYVLLDGQPILVFGHAGLVDWIMVRLLTEVVPGAHVIATGGLAATIVPHCRTVETIDEFLTLEGLRHLFERNAE